MKNAAMQSQQFGENFYIADSSDITSNPQEKFGEKDKNRQNRKSPEQNIDKDIEIICKQNIILHKDLFVHFHFYPA
jgi:hypothetical protein